MDALLREPIQILQRGDGDKLACAFAVFDDAADAERMIERLQRVADFQMLRSGLQIVDDHVVRTFKRSAGKIMKSATDLIERLQIDAIKDFDRSRRRDLHDHRRDSGDVVQLTQLVGNLHRNRRTAHPHDQRRSRRLHHNVGANAYLAAAAVIQNAQHDAHDQQNEGDLNRDGEHADNGAKRPVHQVRDDHPVHHEKLDCIGCMSRPARSAAPAGAGESSALGIWQNTSG